MIRKRGDVQNKVVESCGHLHQWNHVKRHSWHQGDGYPICERQQESVVRMVTSLKWPQGWKSNHSQMFCCWCNKAGFVTLNRSINASFNSKNPFESNEIHVRLGINERPSSIMHKSSEFLIHSMALFRLFRSTWERGRFWEGRIRVESSTLGIDPKDTSQDQEKASLVEKYWH